MPNYVRISRDEITVGTEISVQFKEGGGVGGTVTQLSPLVFVGGTAKVVRSYDDAFIAEHVGYFEKEEALAADECISFSEECAGTVDYRMALSGTGQSFPRCDFHWDVRLRNQERLNRDYPDSPIAPSWFDPDNAGESWDSDY